MAVLIRGPRMAGIKGFGSYELTGHWCVDSSCMRAFNVVDGDVLYVEFLSRSNVHVW